MKGLVFDFVCVFITLFGFLIWYLRKVIKKEKLLEKFDKQEDIFFKVILGALLIWLLFSEVVPRVQDIPYMIRCDYCGIHGISQGNSSTSKLGMVGIVVKDEKTQEEIHVEFGYKGNIVTGDKLVVQYLPHSKTGFLIELNGKPYHKAIE